MKLTWNAIGFGSSHDVLRLALKLAFILLLVCIAAKLSAFML